MNTITIIGISVVLLYCISQIMKFYGIGEETYGIYVAFYIMLLISIFILPNNYPSV
jgi:hypothetical protein